MRSAAGVCEAVIEAAKLGNKYIDQQAPWHLLKTDRRRMDTVLYVLVELIRQDHVSLAVNSSDVVRS